MSRKWNEIPLQLWLVWEPRQTTLLELTLWWTRYRPVQTREGISVEWKVQRRVDSACALPSERWSVLHRGRVPRQRAEAVCVQHRNGQLPRSADHAQLWLGWRRQVWRTSVSWSLLVLYTMTVFKLLISTCIGLDPSKAALNNSLPLYCGFSLGCNIGYGYLHRVPRLLSADSRRVRVPSDTSCSTPEGLTEVSQHVFSEKRIPWTWHSFVMSQRLSAHQVYLSAVIPTEPIPSTALGEPLLSSNPTGLPHTVPF